MNFFTNKIVNPAGGGPSFEEWLATFLTKQASEAKPGLGMDTSGEPRGQMRGQVINNDNEEGAHSYQEGESVDGKKDQSEGKKPKAEKESAKKAPVKKAECGKEMGESSAAGKVTEEHTDAAPGDDESDLKVKINNDPCYQKGESVDPSKAKSKKESSARTPKKTASKVKFEKIASMDRNKKLRLFAVLSSQKKNTYFPVKLATGTTYKPSLAYVEAMVGVTYANMEESEKKWFKDFWRVLYPENYVEEMTTDR